MSVPFRVECQRRTKRISHENSETFPDPCPAGLACGLCGLDRHSVSAAAELFGSSWNEIVGVLARRALCRDLSPGRKPVNPLAPRHGTRGICHGNALYRPIQRIDERGTSLLWLLCRRSFAGCGG